MENWEAKFTIFAGQEKPGYNSVKCRNDRNLAAVRSSDTMWAKRNEWELILNQPSRV